MIRKGKKFCNILKSVARERAAVGGGRVTERGRGEGRVPGTRDHALLAQAIFTSPEIIATRTSPRKGWGARLTDHESRHRTSVLRDSWRKADNFSPGDGQEVLMTRVYNGFGRFSDRFFGNGYNHTDFGRASGSLPNPRRGGRPANQNPRRLRPPARKRVVIGREPSE